MAAARNGDPGAEADERDEATIPLTAFQDHDEAEGTGDDRVDQLPLPGARNTARKSTPRTILARVLALFDRLPTRRVLAILIVIVALYKLTHYLGVRPSYSEVRSKLEEYSARYNPWHPAHGARTDWVDIAPVASVNGKRYRGHQEEEADRFWAWKGIPYAQAPTGDRRFRVAVPLDAPAAAGAAKKPGQSAKRAEEEELLMDKWDAGCVRPRPRPDRTDGPHEEFDGHEDCLKCVLILRVPNPIYARDRPVYRLADSTSSRRCNGQMRHCFPSWFGSTEVRRLFACSKSRRRIS